MKRGKEGKKSNEGAKQTLRIPDLGLVANTL